MHECKPGCMSGPALLHGQAVAGLSVVALQLLVSCAEQGGGGRCWLLPSAIGQFHPPHLSTSACILVQAAI